jgi:hypothetical protein
MRWKVPALRAPRLPSNHVMSIARPIGRCPGSPLWGRCGRTVHGRSACWPCPPGRRELAGRDGLARTGDHDCIHAGQLAGDTARAATSDEVKMAPRLVRIAVGSAKW